MNTIKVNSGATRMIAHRGVSGIEKENSCAAFVAAGNRSYYGIETDVHVTSDGGFIVIHDDDTARVCGENVSVEGSTFEKLRSMRLLGAGDDLARLDLCLPSLEEYISICRKYEKKAVLELKNAMTEPQVLAICECIEGMGMLDDVIFISFAFENLVYIRKKYPEQTVQFLTDDIYDGLLETLVEHRMDLDVNFEALTEENIALLHANGVKVNCWTVDDKQRAEDLIAWGCDFITSNILE